MSLDDWATPGQRPPSPWCFIQESLRQVEGLTSRSIDIKMGGGGGSRSSRHVGSFKLRLNCRKDSQDKLPHAQAKGSNELKVL